MPVSSPSYFPPNRANGTIVGITAGETTTGARNFLGGKAAGNYTDLSDLTVIGDSAFSAGTAIAHNNDPALAGTLAIGSSALAVNTISGNQTFPLPNLAIGRNALKTCVNAGGCVVIGDNALSAYSSTNGGSGNNEPAYNMVVIGQEAMQNATILVGGASGSFESVVIGARCMRGGISGAVANLAAQYSVIIGAAALANAGAGNVISESVIIGQNACSSFQGGSSINNVYIGFGVGGAAGAGTSYNTVIGAGSGPGNQTATNTTIVGAATVAGGGFNTMIGGGQVLSSAAAGCTLIGYGAGNGASAGNDQLMIEIWNGASISGLIYGNFLTGNTILGNSTEGTNRDMPGTNIVKLLNGTKTGAPTGGGFFYVSAGALHWVGGSGTDTTLAPA